MRKPFNPLTEHGARSVVADFERRIAEDPTVLCMLVVGSVARGIAIQGSDIDFAVIHDARSSLEPYEERYGDLIIGCEHYNISTLESWASKPLLDQHDLRQAGRLANSIVRFNRNSGLKELLSSLGNAMLVPDQASRLFASAVANLKQYASGVFERGYNGNWHMQSAALQTAILALNNTPIKYQKLKWVLRDLDATGHNKIAEVLRDVFFCRRDDPTVRHIADSLNRTVTAALATVSGAPTYTYAETGQLEYIKFTAASGMHALDCDMADAAIFCLLNAGRLLRGFIETVAPRQLEPSTWYATVDAQVSDCGGIRANWDAQLDTIRDSITELTHSYSRAYSVLP